MSRFEYVAELDGPQGRIDVSGRRMPGKGGGGFLGAALGLGLGMATGGFSLAGTAFSAAQAGMLGATIGSSLLGGQEQQQQPQQQLQQAPALPDQQAAKTPTSTSIQSGMIGTGQAGGAPGAASTLLTGPGGIDPKTLTLGKNTLLGQ